MCGVGTVVPHTHLLATLQPFLSALHPEGQVADFILRLYSFQQSVP